MRRGYSVVWVAWEGDMLPGDGRMLLDVPIAYEADGSPITGTIRVEYMVDAPGRTGFPLSGRTAAHSFPTVSLDTREAKLTKRRYPYDPPIEIPSGRLELRARRKRLRRRDRNAGTGTDPVGNRHLPPIGISAWLDLRASLHGARPEGDGPGPRGGARRDQLPEIRPQRCESIARRGESLCLGPLADRPLPARFRLSWLQRGCRGPPRVRRRVAARRRRGTQMAEPSFRQPHRLRRPAI